VRTTGCAWPQAKARSKGKCGLEKPSHQPFNNIKIWPSPQSSHSPPNHLRKHNGTVVLGTSVPCLLLLLSTYGLLQLLKIFFCCRHLLLLVRKLGGFFPSQFDYHNCTLHNQYLDIYPSQPLEAIKLQSNKQPSSKFNSSIPYAVRILTKLRPSGLLLCERHP